MFLHNGLKFDRFGDEISGGGALTEREMDWKIAHMATVLNTAFSNLEGRIASIENIGNLYSVTNTYFSTKGRRIVSAKPGIDKTDVVIMEQLNEVHDKVKSLLKGIEVTDDCIKIKGHRRICNVTRAKNLYDVVTDIQRSELYDKLAEFTTEINTALKKIDSDIASLKNKQ